MCCELDSMSELSGFVYIKNHMTLQVKSKAQKVNSYYWQLIFYAIVSRLPPFPSTAAVAFKDAR